MSPCLDLAGQGVANMAVAREAEMIVRRQLTLEEDKGPGKREGFGALKINNTTRSSR